MTSADPITPADKRLALARLLESRTLGRSEQLRSFLRYVCEAEFEGRAREINEYALGVFALGRPADYSPAEDSCVRSRAHELRNKLKQYYQAEAPAEEVRIEIDKGGYVPRFTRAPERQSELPPRQEFGFATPELEALWRPFVGTDAPLLIVFDVRLFFHAVPTGLVVRDYRTNEPDEAARSAPLEAFRERMGVETLEERRDYADFGTVHAAFLFGRLLANHGPRVGMKHTGSLDWQDIWNNNVIAIGKPHLNPTLSSFLQNRDFFVDEYGVICNPRPRPGELERYASAGTHGFGEKYALITRVPGPQPGRHLLLLSGPGAELMWALAESVTSPEYAKGIVERLKGEGSELPNSFQVLIRATFESNVPVKIQSVAHRVLPRP